MAERSKLELRFLGLWEERGLPELEEEYRFHPVRKWRVDFALPDLKIGIEVEGGTWGKPVYCPRCRTRIKGVWKGGRHNHPSSFPNDCEKYNHAAMLGWRIFRLTEKMFHAGLDQIEDFLKETAPHLFEGL